MGVASFFFDYTLRVVALGAAVLGAVSGGLGAYAVLRRQSLLGDAISHAALPGIGLAFLLTGSRATPVLVLGAAVAGWLGALAVLGIVRATRIKEDSALGLVLSVFFGLGLVVLTFVQRRPDAAQAGLDTFLFGQAATLLARDVAMIALVGGVAFVLVAAFWKEFKILSFDPDFAASVGLPVRGLDILLRTLLVVAIVIGLQTVGVVLMSAMVVAPAAAARQWTDRLGTMVVLGSSFGALAGVGGAVISSFVTKLPTGPMIVLCMSVIVVVSLLFAPGRGVVWNRLEHRRSRRRLRTARVLADLYALAGQHGGAAHGHPAEVLEVMSGRKGDVRRSLERLERRGLARRTVEGWTLTPAGMEAARRLSPAREGAEA